MLEVESITQRFAASRLSDRRRVAMAVLVEVSGSAPLDIGATMVIDSDLGVEGSVTGGCVEAALVMEAERVFAGGGPTVLRYGISDDVAGGVGLMCGGRVRIFLSELDARDVDAISAPIAAGASSHPAIVTCFLDGRLAGRRLAVTPEGVSCSLDRDDPLVQAVVRDATALLARGSSTTRHYSDTGSPLGRDVETFFGVFSAAPRLFVIGAVDFSAALAAMATELGYDVTICDPRETFLGSDRYRRAANVSSDWPDRYLAEQDLRDSDTVLVFTHDPKLDEPALVTALRSRAGFVGALGSRSTDATRRARLRVCGLEAHELDRLVCPLGLDIGSATPAETAVSILAQLITHRTGRAAVPLTESDGPIRTRRVAQAIM